MKAGSKNKVKQALAEFSNEEKPVSDEQKRQRRFTLNDTERFGFQLELLMPTFLLGLGTTGTMLVDWIIRSLLAEVGHLPRSLQYLTVDLAENSDVLHKLRHRSLGVNGAGSDPKVGRKAFLSQYGGLVKSIRQQCLTLSADDPLVPALHTRREAMAFYIFGGSGGSSGGMFDPAITLVNDVLRRLSVVNGRVHVVLLGPEMAMRDADRTTVEEQQCVVRDTASLNLAKFTHEFMSGGTITEQPPGESPFTIPVCERVWSTSVVDQSNGQHDCAVTDELLEIVALSYYSAIFTRCTSFVEDRVKDLEKLNFTARGLLT